MEITKKHCTIIAVVIAVIVIWYFFFKTKKVESNYEGESTFRWPWQKKWDRNKYDKDLKSSF